MLNTPLAALYSGNMGLRDIVSLRQNVLRFLAGAYFFNRRITQATVPVVKSVMMTALNCGVGIVFCNSSETQVRRIYARRIIAGVHHNLAVRNFTYDHPINIAMCLGSPASLSFAGCDDAIPECGAIPGPKPASGSFLDPRFDRNRRKDQSIFVQIAKSAFSHVTQFAQVAAKGLRFAKQTFFITLFHGRPLGNGLIMTLP